MKPFARAGAKSGRVNLKSCLMTAYVVLGIFFSCVIPIAQMIAQASTPPTPRWQYLTLKSSRVNDSYRVMNPTSPVASVGSLTMSNGSTATWLSAESYQDGVLYYAGKMTLDVWWKPQSFCVGRGTIDCRVAATMGYCTATCVSLIPLVDFPQENMADTGLLDAIMLVATTPDLQLQSCPCHIFLQVRSYSPSGRSWLMDVPASHMYTPVPAKPDMTRPIIQYLDDHPQTYLWFMLFLAGGVLLFAGIGLHNRLVAQR